MMASFFMNPILIQQALKFLSSVKVGRMSPVNTSFPVQQFKSMLSSNQGLTNLSQVLRNTKFLEQLKKLKLKR